MQRRVILVILDGWGIAPASHTNAVSMARTPNFDFLWSHYPHTKLAAAGEAVGLPVGQMGNSEVGHLNIGAGRVVLQDLPRITKAIKDGDFFNNKVLAETFAYAKKNKKPVHIMGLLSDGGVHSHISHLFAILEYAKKESVHDVFIHAFTDGRDVEPKSALGYIKMLEKEMALIGVGKIATVSGRFYAMDRDHRWDRTQLAYEAIVNGKGDLADSPEEVIQDSYARGITDEFIRPTVIDQSCKINDGDPVIFFNLRSDRPRQLASALVRKDFSSFKRDKSAPIIKLYTLTEYEKSLPTAGVIFPFVKMANTVSDVLSQHGLSQFHIAETEKYAHVTYFFEGGNEFIEKGEDRQIVPSPKVTTYDLSPAMSAVEVGTDLQLNIGKYDFIVVNFANADMVGHTGKLKETIKACEVVDVELGKIIKKAMEKEYNVIVTADHGNAEQMVYKDGSSCTSHTTNPVPFILIGNDKHKLRTMAVPKLGNIAPTVLDLMGTEKPKEMTESSLCLT